MEDNRYYTPEIEEFHVGFEFESKEGFKFKIKNINELRAFIEMNDFVPNSYDGVYSINLDLYRVKYLDQEDIESLGFKFINEHEYISFYIRDNLRLCKSKKDLEVLIEMYDTEKDTLLSKRFGVLFNGSIKNKSELKRILKQVGVE